ncbi:MAG: CAP domain-containing protein [Sphingomicrobium sp.]
MIREILTAVAVLLPVTAAATPIRGTLPWTDPRPAARDATLLRATMVTAHNQARQRYGVGPLAWNDGLARDAALYARRLAASARFEHDPQPGRRPKQGENLWMGTRSAYSYGEMINLLIAERRDFRPGRFPAVSRTGRWSDVGHYTQIVWPTTQLVGCATASNRGSDYLVCRYWPAGNIVGVAL